MEGEKSIKINGLKSITSHHSETPVLYRKYVLQKQLQREETWHHLLYSQHVLRTLVDVVNL
jgi:hypothetical protein